MTRLLVFSLCVLFCSLILRERNRTLSFVVSLAGVCGVLAGVLKGTASAAERLKKLAASFAVNDYISLMLRVLALTLLAQAVSDICRDNGENALASACEFGAKIIVLTMVFPLFEAVAEAVDGMLK